MCHWLQHTRGKAFDDLDTNKDGVIDRSEYDAATPLDHSSSRKGLVADLRRLLSDKVKSMGSEAENGILQAVQDTSADGEIVARVVAVIGELISFAGERADAVRVLQGIAYFAQPPILLHAPPNIMTRHIAHNNNQHQYSYRLLLPLTWHYEQAHSTQ